MALTDEEFLNQELRRLGYKEQVLVHAIMAMMLDCKELFYAKLIVEDVNYEKFAYDVVEHYLSGCSPEENAPNVEVANSALMHVLVKIQNWMKGRSVIETPGYGLMGSFCLMPVFIAREMSDAPEGFPDMILKTITLDKENCRLESKYLDEYMWLVHDNSVDAFAEALNEDPGTIFYDSVRAELYGSDEDDGSTINTAIYPQNFYFISSAPKTYYRRKLKELFLSLEAIPNPKPDDFIGVKWNLFGWILHGASCVDARDWEFAAYILDAVISETLKATAVEGLSFRKKLVEDKGFKESIRTALKNAGDLCYCSLEYMDNYFLCAASTRYMQIYRNPEIQSLDLIDLHELINHCEELIEDNKLRY